MKGSNGRGGIHRHYLYTASVQSVDADLAFVRRIYNKSRGRAFHRLREDFCGTAVLAHEWARRDRSHEAWGVDLDEPTLRWSRERYSKCLDANAASRLHLVRGDVLEQTAPKVDVVLALNFSYSVFKTREELGAYFRAVRRSLSPGGILFLDAWGGAEAMCEDTERRHVPSQIAFDGTRVPAFTYIWDQAVFNPIDHAIVCHIHFRFRDGTQMRRAFTYDWRMWMLPEMRELLARAGFESSEVYVEGWDDDADESDGVFRRRKRFENQAGWVAYLVAYA